MTEGGGEEQTNDARNGKPDVFISYASHDTAVANDVAAALEGQGLKCWIAPRDVTPGAHYASEIVHAIDSANAIVLILSQDAATSPHVLREVERATSKRHPVVTLRVDQAALSAEFEYFLNTSQWLDASGGDATRMMPKLVAAVRLAIRRPVSPAPALSATSAAGTAALASHAPSGGARLRHRTAIVAGVVAAIAIAGLVAYRSLQPAHRAVVSPAPTAATTQATAPAAPTISEKSIAVLPFTDMSEKKDQEYFGDGMAEEILDLLAKAPGLKVIARTSSFQFKGKMDDLRKIAATLNVSYVVEGSVRRSGDQVRVTAQLIDARSGTHRWSETYDRSFRDVLKLQSEIATTIARELEVATGATDTTLGSRFHNPEAYTVYLRGRSALDRGDRTRLSQAQHYFEQALALDPGWSRPAEALAWAFVMQVQFQFVASSEGWRQAQRAAELALRIDPASPSGHAVLGQLYALRDFNWDQADSEFATALRADPNNIDAMMLSANALAARGRLREGIEREDAALTVDPLNPEVMEGRAIWLYFLGDLDGAEREIRNCLTVSPTYTYAHFVMGQILLARRDNQAALRESLRETPEGGRDLGLAVINFALGRADESNAAMARLARENGELWPYAVAEAHAFRNERQQAFDWLNRAYDARDSDLQFVRNDPLLAPIRADTRYRTLLRKMNLPD